MTLLLEIIKKSVSDLDSRPFGLLLLRRCHGEWLVGCCGVISSKESMRESSRREQLEMRNFGLSQITSATAHPPYQHPHCATAIYLTLSLGQSWFFPTWSEYWPRLIHAGESLLETKLCWHRYSGQVMQNEWRRRGGDVWRSTSTSSSSSTSTSTHARHQAHPRRGSG